MSDIVVAEARRSVCWPPRRDATGRRARAHAASMKLAVINCICGVLCRAICSPSQVVQLYRAGLVDTSEEDV